MIALDTNVLVRLVVNDELAQARSAARLIDAKACFIPLTVMLELEWVLRGVYKLERVRIGEVLAALVNVRNLHFESEPLLIRAMEIYRAGTDFADALHHAGAAGCDAFFTFDRKFNSQAKKLTLKPSCKVPPV